MFSSALCCSLLTLSLCAATRLQVLPTTVTLSTTESRQQLLAQAQMDAHQEDWSRTAIWTSSNPAIATVDASGMVLPKANGAVTITAEANGLKSSVNINVKDMEKPFAWSFRNHVIPVFSKKGCNQGACHGALAGKGGFKLTLRGYDPELDYDVLTRQTLGRRVALSNPENSLILQKPTFGIPHGGGKLIDKKQLEYRVIQEWIAAGAPAPPTNEAEVRSIEVFPKNATLKPAAEQQLVVRALYSDGRVEDVTRWAKFTSNDEGVALVEDGSGRVKMTGPGEAAITVWFSSKVLYARMTTPFNNTISADTWSKFPRRNAVDDFVLARLKSLNIEPSGLSTDSAFIRRAFLDATGTLPTAEEVEEFFADQSPNKREKLVDRILAKEEFNDYWAYKWSDVFLISSRRLQPTSMWAFYNWIRDSVKENRPWDRMARDIFTSTGSTRQNGALNYFVLHKDPILLSENITQAFLGQRLTCARCHNHPMEKWTQKQYYQMANLFSRVGIKNGTQPGENIIFARTSGDVLHPRLLRPMEPAPLDGKTLTLESLEDRRLHFADWLTSKDNVFFQRNLVNRVWGNFMGRGFTDPVDDVRATNPSSNEDLFNALCADFAKDFDVKRLIRTVMTSGAYQLAADPNGANQNDNKYYSKYILKRLPAETLLDIMSQVTGSPTGFSGYPAGTRAMQLPDVTVQNEFLNVFGRPKRIVCDAGERSAEPSIGQALHVINGDTLNKKLSDPNGYAAQFLKIGLPESRLIDQVYLSAFSRYPKDEERAQARELLAKSKLEKGTPDAIAQARRQGLEDLMWALLTSKEFLFNQ
jgi:hypothetical protein